MKKYRALILIVCAAALFLWGCAYEGKEPGGASEEAPILNIGIDSSYEPYSYIDENGNFAGLDIALAKEACRRMGRTPVFHAIKWDDKDAYLKDGTIDCIWSCFSMSGREADYEWVGSYMYSRQVVAVRSDSDIMELKDLTGRRVAVMSSTKPESIFLERDSEKIPLVKDVYCMADMNLVFAALQSGYVDAAAGHETAVRQYMETTPGEYRLLEEELLSVEVGIAFEKTGDKEIPGQLDKALQEMRKDGSLSGILSDYGISAGEPAGGGLQ